MVFFYILEIGMHDLSPHWNAFGQILFSETEFLFIVKLNYSHSYELNGLN